MAHAKLLTSLLSTLLCIAFSSAQQCVPLTISACKNAGYNLTARFAAVNGTPFQTYTAQRLRLTEINLSELKSCKYTAAVMCSLYLPQCVEGRKEPLLPCRNVCREFASSCNDTLKHVGMSGVMRGLCEFLPEGGNADRHRNNSERICFVPEGFHASPAAGEDVTEVCHKITVPECRSLHYNYTLLPNTSQAADNVFGVVQPVIKSNCSSNATSFFCFTQAPPCFSKNDSKALHVPCKSFCRKFVEDCGRIYKNKSLPGLPVCEQRAYPDESSSTGLCTIYRWPAPWPETPSPGSNTTSPTSGISTKTPTFASNTRTPTSASRTPTSASNTRKPTSASRTPTSASNTRKPTSASRTPTSASNTRTPTSASRTPTSASNTRKPTSLPHKEQSTFATPNCTFAKQSTVTVAVTPTTGNGSVGAKPEKLNKAGIIAGVTVTVVVIIIFALIAVLYYRRHVIKGPEATHQLVDMEDIEHPY